MVQKFIKSFATAAFALAAILVTGSTKAATPVAVWDGDLVNNSTKNNITLTLNGNSVENGIVTIDQAKGIQFYNNNFNDTIITVLVKYSNLDTTSTTSRSIVTTGGGNNSTTTGTYDDYLGLYALNGSTVKGIVSGAVWNKDPDDASKGNFSSSGIIALAHSYNDGGTKGYMDGTLVYDAGGLRGQYMRTRFVGVGGNYATTGSGKLAAATGMKIEGVAIFKTMLSQEDIAAYKWPSEWDEYVGTFSQNVTGFDDANIVWTKDGEVVDYADISANFATSKVTLKNLNDATFACGTATTVGYLSFNGTGTLTYSPSAQITSAFGCCDVNSGTLKMTSGTSYGSKANMIRINPGASVDNNGVSRVQDYSMILNGGTYMDNAGSGHDIAWTYPVTKFYLTADSTIYAGKDFGLIGSNYAATSIDLNGYTLTKKGPATLYLLNTTFNGTGKFVLEEGTINDSKTTFSMANSTLELAGGTVNITTSGTINELRVVGGKGATITALTPTVTSCVLDASKVDVSDGRSVYGLFVTPNSLGDITVAGVPEGYKVGKSTDDKVFVIYKADVLVAFPSTWDELKEAVTYGRYNVVTAGAITGSDTFELPADVTIVLGGDLSSGEINNAGHTLTLSAIATTTVSTQLTGAGAVHKTGAGTLTFSCSSGNPFTGGFYADEGTSKATGNNKYGTNNASTSKLYVGAGATLDLANTANGSYLITSNGGTITNSGDDIGNGARQLSGLTLNADTTITGNTFAMLAYNYGSNTLALNDCTLTVQMNSGKLFFLCNTTVTGTGTILVKSGKFGCDKDGQNGFTAESATIYVCSGATFKNWSGGNNVTIKNFVVENGALFSDNDNRQTKITGEIDLSRLTLSTDSPAFGASANLRVMNTTTFKFPAGAQADVAYKLAGDTLNVESENVNTACYIGEELTFVTLTYDTTNKTVSYALPPKAKTSETALDWSATTTWENGVVPDSGLVEIPAGAIVNINVDIANCTICGAGTVIYNNKLPGTEKAGYKVSAWTGTVWLNGYTTYIAGFDPDEYGNESSKLTLTGISCWMANNKTYKPEIILKDDEGVVALSVKDGSTNNLVTFNKLSGDGTFITTSSGGSSQKFRVLDGAGFSGSITMQANKGVAFGTSASAGNNQIVVASGVSIAIDAEKIWTAAGGIIVNGTICGAGTLASATTFGEGATMKPTKGGLKFNAAVTGEPIIDCSEAIKDGVCEGTLATFTGSVPTYTFINNGSVLVFTEGLSVKFRNYAARWGYANNVFNWRTPTSQGNFHQGTWSSFNLETGEETEHTASWNAEFGNVTAPGNVMRYDAATYRQSSDASFYPLTFGGLIVEAGATGYAVTGSGTRPTYLGDTAGNEESYFLFNETWTINRQGATTIYGPANIEVAAGKIFDCNSSQTSYNTVLATGKNTVLKLHGEGTMKVTKLVATGDVGIDLSDLKDRVNTAPFITGSVQIDATTKLYFPEGFAEDSDFVLCSGLIDGPSTLETTIYVGGEAKSVVLSVNGNKLRYFTPVNTTWVGGASGNWNDENSWDNGVPDNHSIATVNNAATIALPAEVSGGILKLNAAVKFTAASGSATLDVGSLVKGDAVAVTLGAGVTYTLKETAIPAGFKFEAGGKIAGVAVPALSGATITVAGEVATGAYTILEWTDLMAKNSAGYGAPTLSLETADENVRLLCLSDRVVLQKIDPTTPVTKVWCVGDSITEGYNGQNTSANYRTQLAAELSILGYNPKMVGDIDVQSYMPSGAEAPEEWRRHSGHSAQRIWTRNVNGGSNSRAGYLEAIDAAMYQVGDDVDVVTVKLGTNDLLSNNGGDTVDHAFEGLQLLIDKIVDGMPHARIVVATIIPSTGGGNGNFAPYNTKIKDWLNTKPYGDQVVCADLYTSLTTAATERGIAASELTVDGTHPTWSGDGFLAKTLSTAVDGALKNGYTPTTPTRVTETMGAANNTEIADYREGFTHYASLAIPEKATYALNATMSDVGYTDVAEEAPAKIGKVAYYLELARAREDGTLDVRYVWADMDAISEDVDDLLVPVAGTQNGTVTRLHVKSNMGSVTTIEPTENTVNGYVEFTPYTATANAVSTGPTALWPCMDWNDTLPTTGDVGGRGSMQIHRINDADSHNGGEVIFAWNNWGAANNPDVMTLSNKEDARCGEIGIGNFAQHYMTDTSKGRCTGSLINAKFGNSTIGIDNNNVSADYNSLRFSPWGDAMNAKAYTVRNLEIWVQEKFDDLVWDGDSGTWTATSFNGQAIYTKEGAHAVEFADKGESTEALAITVDGDRSVTRMTISAVNRAVSFTSGSVEATSLVKAADTLELTINNDITVVGDAEFNGGKVSVNGELTVNGNAAFNCGELAIAKDAVVFVKGATSGTAKITGTGRLVVYGSHLPASTLTGLTDSATWTGTVEFRDFEHTGDTHKIINFMGYANTASTIALNNVNATMFGGNATYPNQTFGYLEISEGGWVQPTNLEYDNSPTYTCSLIGTGTLSVMQRKGNNSVTFIGDHSNFGGSVNMASTTTKRLILKGASATTVASAFAARQVVIASDTTINTAVGTTWTAPGGISVEGTLAGSGTMDGPLTLKSGATIDLAGFATELDASAKLIGNFTAATGVIYKFPAGYAENTPFVLCGGTLSASEDKNATIYIGDGAAMSVTLVFDAATKSVKYFRNGEITLTGTVNVSTINQLGTGNIIATLGENATIVMDADVVAKGITITGGAGKTLTLTDTWNGATGYKATSEEIAKFVRASDFAGKMINNTTCVSGAVCYYDWTFTNTVQTTGAKLIKTSAYSKNQATLEGDLITSYADQNEENLYTSLYISVRPYLNLDWNNIDKPMTIALACKMSEYPNTELIALGNQSKCFFFATTDLPNEVQLVYGTQTTDNEHHDCEVITTMSVPAASTLFHVYEITLSADGKTVTVYLDGIEWASSYKEDGFGMNNGLQLGGWFQGNYQNDGFYRDGDSGRTDTTKVGRVKMLRVYDSTLGPKAMEALSDEFPYNPQYGAYSRTLDEATEDWSATGAWTDDDDQPADAPVNGSVANLTVGVNSELTINVDDEIHQESVSIVGQNNEDQTLRIKAGTGTIINDGATVITTPVTIEYGAMTIAGGPTRINGNGSVTFDFSNYPIDTVFGTGHIGLTGLCDEPESDDPTTWPVKLIVPTDLKGRTMTIGYTDNNKYELVYGVARSAATTLYLTTSGEITDDTLFATSEGGTADTLRLYADDLVVIPSGIVATVPATGLHFPLAYFQGEGTVVFDGYWPNATIQGQLQADTWDGTAWIKNISNGSSMTFNQFGNANSVVRLTGIKGWMDYTNTDTTIPVELKDENNVAAFEINDGSKGRIYSFAKLIGDGTFKVGVLTAHSTDPYVAWIKDASTFTGKLLSVDGDGTVAHPICVGGESATAGTTSLISIAGGTTVNAGCGWQAANVAFGATLKVDGDIDDVLVSGVTTAPTSFPQIMTDDDQPANLRLVYEDGNITLKKLLDATVEGGVGYNYAGISVDINITTVGGEDLKNIKVIAKNSAGEVVESILAIDGADSYVVPVEGLIPGWEYTYEVQILGADGETVKIANLASGDVMLGKSTPFFSADATSGTSIVDGGEWVSETAPEIENNAYQITDEADSVFTVTAESNGTKNVLDFQISFAEGFITEAFEAETAKAGITVGKTEGDETSYFWQVVDGGGFVDTTTTLTPGSFTVRMVFDYTAGTVRYLVKGDNDESFVTLKDSTGKCDFAITGMTTISSVSFSGESALAWFGAASIDTYLASVGGTKYATVADALANAGVNDAVTLLTNIDLNAEGVKAGSYNIVKGSNKFRWTDGTTDAGRIIVYENNQFVIKQTKPANGIDSFTSYVLQLNPEDATDKPVGVAPADNLDPDTLTVEINGPDGKALNPRKGYTLKYIAVPTVGEGKKVVSDEPEIDLPLPESGEVKYSIKVEVK